MDPASDSRIAAFKRFVEEARDLCHQLNTAEQDELLADDITAQLANPGTGDDVQNLRKTLATFGNITALRHRHAVAKLRFQLHLNKGRKIKQAAVDAAREILLSAVGGESSLTTCPIGPFAQHYLDEVRKVGCWSSPGATLQQVNHHLSEALETLERAVSESDLIRRDKEAPPQWMVERFDDLLAFHGSQEVMSAALLKQAEADYAHLPLAWSGQDAAKCNLSPCYSRQRATDGN